MVIKKIRVFVTQSCSECVHVKKMLDELGLEYDEVDISDDKYRAKVVECTGCYSVPQVTCGDRYLGDYKRIVSLYKQKELADTIRQMA